MSRVKQLADAEADEVEAEAAEDDETDTDGDPVPDSEPEAAPDDGPSVEAQLQAFDRENERHAEAVATLLGSDLEAFEPCEYCNAVGFKVRVPYQRDPNLTMCGACAGHGLLITGSLEPSNAVRACQMCGGAGFVTKPLQPPPAPQTATYAYPPPPPGYEPPRPLDLPASPAPDGSGWAPGYTPPGQPMPGGR